MAAITTGTITLVPPAAHAAGTFTIPPSVVLPNVTHILLQVDRTAWSSFDGTVSVLIEYSGNGGTTWNVVGGLGTTCGPCSLLGQPVNAVGSDFNVPGIGNATRQIRGSFTLTGNSKTTGMTAVVT